jgi:hypothetical protein
MVMMLNYIDQAVRETCARKPPVVVYDESIRNW